MDDINPQNQKIEQNRTKEKKKALIDALPMVRWTIAKACRMVGIHRDTYYDWLKKDPEFKKTKDESSKNLGCLIGLDESF